MDSPGSFGGARKGLSVIDLDDSVNDARDHELDLPGEWSVSGAASGPGGTQNPLHIVVLDHRDSFTYNLVQALAATGARISVRVAETISLEQLERLAPDRLLLSPGPGSPRQARLARQALERYRGQIPILGVCLGHQVIAESLGAEVVTTGTPTHGKSEAVYHCGTGLFAGVPDPFMAARYHSLAVRRESLPPSLQLLAINHNGMVMAVGVPGEPTWGLQFHPESFLTPDGDLMLSSFVSGVCCEKDDRTRNFERMDSGAF